MNDSQYRYRNRSTGTKPRKVITSIAISEPLYKWWKEQDPQPVLSSIVQVELQRLMDEDHETDDELQ